MSMPCNRITHDCHFKKCYIITAQPHCNFTSDAGELKKTLNFSQVTKVHWVVLICDSVAISQTPAEAASPRTWGQYITWSACSAPSFRQYQFILLGDRGKMVCCEKLAYSLGMCGMDVSSSVWF